MELYMNYKFVIDLLLYLTEEEDIDTVDSEDEGLLAFRNSLYAMADDFDEEKSMEKIEQIIDAICSSNYGNTRRIEGLQLLRSGFWPLSKNDVLNLYAILFDLSAHQLTSFPVYMILLDYYANIVIDMYIKNKEIVRFDSEDDINLFVDELYQTLAHCSLKICSEADINIFGDIEDDNEDILSDEESLPYEEFLFISCCVNMVEDDIFEQVQDINNLTVYEDMDIDPEVLLIGNIITFINANRTKAVSYQIVGHKNQSHDLQTEEAVQLKVHKLIDPIMNIEDFKKIQEATTLEFDIR